MTQLPTLKEELFGGWSPFEKFLVPGLVLMQLIVYITNPEDWIGMLAGVSGVLCVTFVAKGKISNYFFGLIQVVLYLYLSWQAVLYGEVLLNLFYFVAQFTGFYAWHKNLQTDTTDESEAKVVKAKGLSPAMWLVTIASTVVAWYGFGLFLQAFGSNQPFIDSITTSLSVVAQILMIYRYKEQWLFWILVNITSIWLWYAVSSPAMIAMYVGFLINSIYGWLNWLQLKRQAEAVQVSN